MLFPPFFDPAQSYEDNFKKGPFAAFSNGKILENKGEPRFDFLGHKVFSPFGIAAGPLINGRFVEAALDKGFDIVTYKTVRSSEYPCHPWPNVVPVKVQSESEIAAENPKAFVDKEFKEPLSITNSFGVPSFDPKFWQEDMKKVLKKMRKGQILVGAFQGTKREGQSREEYINDFINTARLLKDTGVKVIEVNLSCPNEGTNNLLCYDVDRSAKVVQAIKKEIGDIPLIIKIGYFRDEKALYDLIKEVGPMVQGISAINTIPAEILDENGEQALPGKGRLKSGICGHIVKWAGLEMVKRLKKLRADLGYSFSIIGVGGVASYEDFSEYRNSGADIVMAATGAMWNPYLAKEIKERLR